MGTLTSGTCRILLLGLAAIGLSACSGTIKPGFYSPTQTGQRLPMRVALLDDHGLHPQPYDYRPSGGTGTFTLTLEPEFSNAIKAEMASLFDSVTVVPNAMQAKDHDLIAQVSSSFQSGQARISLALLMPDSAEFVHRTETSSPIKAYCNSSCKASAFFTGFTLFLLSPITIPAMIEGQIEPTRTSIEEATRATLIKFGNEIRSSDNLVRIVRDNQAGRAALAAAEQAERTGDKLAALSNYAKALMLHPGVKPDPALDRKLLAKIETLVPVVGTLPTIPDEARRHMARSNAFMKNAASEGYGKVLAEIDEAMKIAPLWPEAVFNRGLIEEAAGQYPQAIRSLSLYLRLAPGAQDAKAVQNKIYELEAMMEQAGKNAATQHSMHRAEGDQRVSHAVETEQGVNP